MIKSSSFLKRGAIQEGLANTLEEYDCEIIAVYPSLDDKNRNNKYWGVYIKPNSFIQNLMATRGLILLLAAEVDDLEFREAKILDELKRAAQPSSLDYQVSEEMIILLSSDSKTSPFTKSIERQIGIPIIGFSFTEFEQRDLFEKRIQARLFARDLYSFQQPIKRKSQFYGRTALLDELMDQMVRSKNHIGLFGLRKMGKTSCIYMLEHHFQKHRRVIFCHVDMQLVDARFQNANYLAWSIGESIISAMGRKKIPNLRLFGHYSIYADVEDTDLIPELFMHDMKIILDQLSVYQIVIAFDEIELMSPDRAGPNWGFEFNKAWELLRGLDQQFQDQVSYLIAGTNPTIIERGYFANNQANPIFMYFKPVFLKPFDLDETNQLLNGIGKQIGLTWDDKAVSKIHNLTGGHPMLTRLCGAVIHKSLGRREETVDVNVKSVDNYLDVIVEETQSRLEEMVRVLQSEYEDEFMLLELLARGQEAQFRDYANANPRDVSHLKSYGLITHKSNRSLIRLALLQSWLQRQRQKKKLRITEGSFEPGNLIGDHYEVISNYGHPGGFSEVYLCRDQRTGNQVVVKTLPNGDYSSLMRETDILEKLTHKNIVRILDKGAEGIRLPYFVMEYLEGYSLRHYCTAATRLSIPEVYEITTTLLEVLCYIHPNPQTIDQISTKADSTAYDSEKLELARHGYVHRDIKPENVILVKDRGAVLIDFNISVRCGDVVRTRSYTPGTFPPDWEQGNWDQDIDLYQLGLTLLQVATGISFDPDHYNLDSIVFAAKQDLPKGFSSVLERLCFENRRARFNGAQQALEEMRKVSI